MQNLSRRTISYIVLALGLLAPLSEASADSIRIDFDFTAGSFLSLLGGTIVTPPDGTFTSGFTTLLVEGTDISTVVPGGAVVLKNGQFAGTVVKNVGGQADINGPYSGVQVGELAGTLAAGEVGANFTQDIFYDLDITLGCVGSGCAPLGFPINVVGVNALNFSFVSITGLNTPGGANISMTGAVSLNGVLGDLTLSGVEVNRFMVVPEPQTGTLLLMGLSLLGFSRTRFQKANGR